MSKMAENFVSDFILSKITSMLTEIFRINGELEKLDRAQQCLSDLENRLQRQINEVKVKLIPPLDKKPYKCPVCDGYAFICHQIVQKIECHACEGKGVLWR